MTRKRATMDELISAASDAVGWDVDEATIRYVERGYVFDATGDLQSKLERAERLFDDAGARGVELADEIDRLRIAIAIRGVK